MRLPGIALFLLALPAALAAAPQSVAVIDGAEYVDALEAGSSLGLKVVPTANPLALTLERGGIAGTLMARDRIMLFDGVRVYFGSSVEERSGKLLVSAIDYEAKLLPLWRPDLLVPLRRPHVIVLDPGHGGWDSGAENLTVGVREKDVTLDLAFRLRQLLEREGWTVVLTRTSDTGLSEARPGDKPQERKIRDLDARSAVAVEHGADVFLSLHFDADEARVLRGAEVFSLAPAHQWASDDWESRSKPRAASDAPGKYDAPFPGNRQDGWNVVLAHSLYRNLPSRLHTDDRGERIAHWRVLRGLTCPGVLIEPAYLSRDSEALRVKSPEFRQDVAEAIAAGLKDYAGVVGRIAPAKPSP